MVKINGEEVNAAGKTAAQYLTESGYDLKRVAVELNGDILPKSQYESTVLKDSDCVEIVSFVGGG
ncbi:MAG: sulfur carrier protein ThiS [Ruminococcus sp.]|nr:sulfur carrier protein ThiS [Ruminococcus sp.]